MAARAASRLKDCSYGIAGFEAPVSQEPVVASNDTEAKRIAAEYGRTPLATSWPAASGDAGRSAGQNRFGVVMAKI